MEGTDSGLADTTTATGQQGWAGGQVMSAPPCLRPASTDRWDRTARLPCSVGRGQVFRPRDTGGGCMWLPSP